MNNNEMNKEAIQLLNASDSDSASDIQFSLAPQPIVQVRRKVRTKRKQRKDGEGRSTPSSTYLPCSIIGVLKIACISFAVGGVLILGWVVLVLHSEVQQLTEKLSNLPPPNDDETILGLKRAIKELNLNQTFHLNAIQNCSKVMADFQRQVSVVSADVIIIRDSLKEAPQMLNIGKELDSLKTSLATYEATISDLKLSLSELKLASSSSSMINTIDSLNSTLHGRIDNAIRDLHQHQDAIILLQNATEQLKAQSPAAFNKRVDAVQSALIRLEVQQKNNTVTLDYAMDIVQKMDSYMKKHPDS